MQYRSEDTRNVDQTRHACDDIYNYIYKCICNVDEMRHACDVDQERHHKKYTMYIRRRDMHCRSEEKSQEMCNVDQERLLD